METSEKETARLESFSDGVFAIAITLLAIELRIPERADSNVMLLDQLWNEWPAYLAFTLSFFSILIMWANHHSIFFHINKINRKIILANGFMLFLVTIVNFPTNLISRYFNTPSENAAAALYCGLFVIINISYNVLWYVVSTDKLVLRKDVTPETIHILRRNYLIGFPAYTIAFGTAFYSAKLSLLICTALWVFWAITTTTQPGNRLRIVNRH
jgi:uncharacterized membrane protein